MPELKNPKHERFAQLLAEGMTQVDAYEESGYKRNDGNAAVAANREDVQARVKETKGKGATGRSPALAVKIIEAHSVRPLIERPGLANDAAKTMPRL
jgi:hypothetical protein